MVATSIMSTDAEMNAMVGENVDVTGWTDANKTAWGLHAECFLNNLAHYNFSDNFATLNVDVKYILSEYVARYVAVCGITYNINSYPSRIEAEDMINMHTFRIQEIEKLLTKEGALDFLKGA